MVGKGRRLGSTTNAALWPSSFAEWIDHFFPLGQKIPSMAFTSGISSIPPQIISVLVIFGLSTAHKLTPSPGRNMLHSQLVWFTQVDNSRLRTVPSLGSGGNLYQIPYFKVINKLPRSWRAHSSSSTDTLLEDFYTKSTPNSIAECAVFAQDLWPIASTLLHKQRECIFLLLLCSQKRFYIGRKP